ncbi:MAG: MATE family efflux transporter [Clostridia bacterium]|nr:MATE family efflux transporter [Clostridia bacterium]
MKAIGGMRDRSELLLREKNLYKAFAIMAMPIFLANILRSLHDLVDTHFIGQMVNSTAAQAGISIAWPFINILLCFSAGLSVGGVAIISRSLGMGDTEKAKRYSALLLTFSACIGVVINLIMYLAAPLVLRLMNADADLEVFAAALTYVRVRAFEMVFLFVFAAFQTTRQACGDTVSPVLLSVVSIVVNVVLTWLFVTQLNMGVFGAALATLIGNAVIVPYCVYMMFSKRNQIAVEKRHFTIDFEEVKSLVKIGIPSASSQALTSLGFLVLQAVILDYGKVVAAAFSLGNKVSNLLLMPIFSLGSVLAAFVGQNIGAQNKERAMAAYKTSRNLGLIVSIVGCAILFPIRENILALLTNDADTLVTAMDYILWVLLTQPLMAMFQNYIGLFNGSGNTKLSFIMGTVRLWVIRLPLILCFKLFTDLGSTGVWYAMVISNLLIMVVGMLLKRKVNYEKKI